MSSPVLRRPARRLAVTVLATLAAALLSLLLLTTSALATEGEGVDEEHAEEEGGFGSGRWDGMLLAGGVGIVLGLVVFGASDPAGIKPTDDHHDAAAKAHAEPPM